MNCQRFIVQSLEDYTFLFPDDSGYVGYCNRIDQAGFFETIEEAIEAAGEFIGHSYVIFTFSEVKS